jgi:hypothetical protein
MIKPIITDQDGQYRYPGIPTVIKGNPFGTSITMAGVPPAIAVTPYGAAMIQPNMDYNFRGDNLLELPMGRYGGCMDCQEQFPQAQNLNWFYKAQGGEAFPQANMYPESWVGYNGTQYRFGGEGEEFPQAQTYLPYDRQGETRPNFMLEYGGQSDLEKIYQVMKKGGFNMNPRKKKGGGESFDQFMMRMGGLPKAQWGPPGTIEESVEEPSNQQMRQMNRAQRQMSRNANPYAPTGLEYANAIMGSTPGGGMEKAMLAALNIGSALGDAASGYGKLLGIKSKGGDLPKHQIKGQTYNWTPQSVFQGANQFMPQSVVEQNAQQQGWENFNRLNPMQSFENYLGHNTTTTTAGDAVSFKPGSTADPANPNYQQPSGPEQLSQQKQRSRFNDLGTMSMNAMRSLNKLDAAARFIKDFKDQPDIEARRQKAGSTDFAYTPMSTIDRGDYGPNGKFRPNEYTYAQDAGNYYNTAPLLNMGRYGGVMDQYEDGGVYDLSQEEIDAILAAGGSIEYI